MSLDERLKQVFGDVFGMPPAQVDERLESTSIKNWDSVAHLNLVLALEAEFGVQFEAEEIPELVSYRVIRSRLADAGQTAG